MTSKSAQKKTPRSWQDWCVYILVPAVAVFFVCLAGALVRDRPGVGLVFLVLAAVDVALLLWVFVKGKRGYRQVEEELYSSRMKLLQEQLQNREERLKALQSQINPHFLYNTLDTIRSMALEKGEDELSDVVTILALMFRYSMDYSNPIVPLHHEIAQVMRYMKIQRLRFPGRFEVEEIRECTESELQRVMLPKFCLQPLVENAISHAFRSKSEGCKLTIRYLAMKRGFQISVEDNGGGMEEAETAYINRLCSGKTGGRNEDGIPGGIALQNIFARLKLHFGEQAGMHIYSTKGIGTSVVLTIPFTGEESL